MTTQGPIVPGAADPEANECEVVDILIVDDKAENLTALEAVLSQPGQRLLKAGSGRHALRHLLTNDVAVILLDIHMPEMDGFETAALIRQRIKNRDVPIIFLTAEYLAREHVSKGYTLKAIDYITKPFNPAILKAKVAVLVELHRKTLMLTGVNRRLEREIAERQKVEHELQDALNRLKASQAVVVDTEKMTALGTLTAGMAHNLFNPMTAILLCSEYCLKYTAAESKTHEPLNDVINETQHCIELLNDLLSYARMDDNAASSHLRGKDLKELINRILRLMSYRLEKENITVTSQIPDVLPESGITSNGIQQILFNLLSNAADAMETCADKRIDIQVRWSGDSLIIAIADSGVGIAAAHVGKIFDPFFTTKSVGKGTGLGLALSRSIVEGHGGSLRCDNAPGKMTIFEISILAYSDNGETSEGGAK